MHELNSLYFCVLCISISSLGAISSPTASPPDPLDISAFPIALMPVGSHSRAFGLFAAVLLTYSARATMALLVLTRFDVNTKEMCSERSGMLLISPV